MDTVVPKTFLASMQRAAARLCNSARTTGAVVLLVAGAGSAHAAAQGPCDLYAAGGTPCVAAWLTSLRVS